MNCWGQHGQYDSCATGSQNFYIKSKIEKKKDDTILKLCVFYVYQPQYFHLALL